MSTAANNVSGIRERKWYHFRERGVLAALVAICIIFSVLSPYFLRPSNLINILKQVTEISIVAIGMTFVIICGEIDLSIGSIYGLCGMIAGKILYARIDPIIAFLSAVIAGMLIGFLNGFLSTKGRIPAFIVTLAMLAIARGAAFGITGGNPVSNFPNTNNWFFSMGGYISGIIPIQVIVMIALNVIAYIVLSRSTFGYKIYATGGNKYAAKLGGINTDMVKITAFMILGALSAFSSLIGISYLKTIPATAGTGREMDVIAAVILGGTALFGGRGSILGAFIGAAIMGIVRNGLVLLGVQAFYQEASVGLVILLAVVADTWLKRDR
jgi:ribose/xylose/arabinose/galactoside ABC-type transport system permease subunit